MPADSLSIIGIILVALIAVWLILKSISVLFKLFTLLCIAGVMYFLYEYHPKEVIATGAIIVVFLVVVWLIKHLFKKKKK